MTPIALDTSVAIPLLLKSHSAHREVVRWWGGRAVALSGHALAETYSVLTRLPAPLRAEPGDVARLLADRFDPPLTLSAQAMGELPRTLADLSVAGGAVYDALVALAALEADCLLATRDARAKTTYDTI
ncbi:MAG: toxin VapC27, partial [Frankiales bacterium]|nr:toxin VapC27 [Frankiales bacterium]